MMKIAKLLKALKSSREEQKRKLSRLMVNKLLNNSKRLTKRSKKKMKLKILAIQRSQAKSQLAKKKMILLRNSIERATTTKSRKLNLINKPLKRRKIPLHLKATRMTRNR